MNKIIQNNSDMFILYDAKMTNPNGNLDDDNRPRIDHATSRSLVSDVRWKRYTRDYAHEILDYLIFCEKGALKVNKLEECKKAIDSNDPAEVMIEFSRKYADVRLFGLTAAIKGKSKKENFKGNYTGPVQFNIGESLHEVELNEDCCSITNCMRDLNEEGEEKGGSNIGKDYRLLYALIGISGTVSANNAKHTGMTEEDVELLDEANIRALDLLKTRSKMGQKTRLYTRIEYINNKVQNSDFLSNYIEMVSDKGPSEMRFIKDYCLDVTTFVERFFEEMRPLIKTVYVFHDPLLKMNYKGSDINNFGNLLRDKGISICNLKRFDFDN